MNNGWAKWAPATETTWSRLPADAMALIDVADAHRLAAERARLPQATARILAEPTYSVRNRFRYWERLIRRMEEGWAPDGFYLVDEYVNDLESRDQIDVLGAAEPGLLTGPLGELLASLDHRFLAATLDDGGAELRLQAPRLGELEGLNARWRRVPRVNPWS
ncbi:hypothetical protein OHA21_36520 [Actinoplanes sp. NBC_00393]|uniref:hypothetical protein n=1 Tax=Actinoplanes sp. NBC_00393 TaxID=2975953 RepID=UPI002E1B7F44